MNKIVLGLAGLLLTAGSVSVFAQQPQQRGQAGPGGGEGPPPQAGVQNEEGADRGPAEADRGRPTREQVLERFDADGDGTLNDEELEAMRKERGNRGRGPGGPRLSREEILERYDADGDGELSEEERETMRQEREARRAERRQEMLNRFDTDSDGQLSPEERKTMRDTIRAERMDAPPPAEEAEAPAE